MSNINDTVNQFERGDNVVVNGKLNGIFQFRSGNEAIVLIKSPFANNLIQTHVSYNSLTIANKKS